MINIPIETIDLWKLAIVYFNITFYYECRIVCTSIGYNIESSIVVLYNHIVFSDIEEFVQFNIIILWNIVKIKKSNGFISPCFLLSRIGSFKLFSSSFFWINLSSKSYLDFIDKSKLFLSSIIFHSNFFCLVEESLHCLSSRFFSMNSFLNIIYFILNSVYPFFQRFNHNKCSFFQFLIQISDWKRFLAHFLGRKILKQKISFQ